MFPGTDNHFRLFLCSRWGKTLAEIDAMPAEEFILHKTFWESYRWGVQDDLISIVLSQILSWRTGKKPDSDISSWKTYALVSGGARKKITQSISSMRDGFMTMVRMLGKDK